MSTEGKDVYSAMPSAGNLSGFQRGGGAGDFGRVQRDEMVASPKRNTTDSKKPKKKPVATSKPVNQEDALLMQKSLERKFEERISSLDDETLDLLFPDGDDSAIDKFVSGLDEKWVFEGVTGVLRRVLGRRRKRKSDVEDDIEVKGGYTKPELRDRIKRRVMAGSRGGKPGQWSARKAQIVAQEYEKAGGGYTGKKSSKQRSLSKWTDENWTTSDGKPAIRKGGTTRYLPEKAWDNLTPAQRAATNRKKREGSRSGRQFVQNTDAAARAGAQARRKSASSSLDTKAAKKPVLRDPKGGLTAAGRAHFKRTQGANLKPGVKGPADTPEKMRRKGSFLTRFFTNPSGPMVGDDGKPTRLALSAAAWGEPIPKNRSDAAKLAAKGRRLLERYQNTKKKK